jgi:membrane-associated protease RseP (regulator of RpoE activity)
VFVIHPPRRRYWLHLLLFVATCFTTLVIGAGYEYNFQHNLPLINADDPHIFPIAWIVADPRNLLLGIPFAGTLLAILLSHEMGHFVFARRNNVYATLPFFIPFPSVIGTLGAFIRIQSPIRSRKALFDIGIAGPIAGFVVALPAMLAGLALSGSSAPAEASLIHFGFPAIFRIGHRLLPGTGTLGGAALHPVAVAAWAGMFATALNLLPAGQLDGGHIIYAVWPRAHRALSWTTVAVLAVLGWKYWAGWAFLAALLFISGVRHPVTPAFPSLPGSRRLLAVFALAMLLLTFAAEPFAGSPLPVVLKQLKEAMPWHGR